jgi:hypothetical protein
VNREVFDKPEEYYSLDKLRQAAAVDRRLTLREILEKIFNLIPRFKSKDELLEEEFDKFVADYKPEEATSIPAIKTYFKAYVTSGRVRTASTTASIQIWPPIRFSQAETSGLFRRNIVSSFRSTLRTTCP